MSEKCGCGCGHDHEHEEDVMDLETMFLTLDDDTEMECGILGVFEVEGLEGKKYIALLPLEDETVLLYEYKEVGDEIELNVIEDDDESTKFPTLSTTCTKTKNKQKHNKGQGMEKRCFCLFVSEEYFTRIWSVMR